MKRTLGVAIASTTSLPGQAARNLEQIAEFARRAAGDGADLLLTPELSASGYGGYPEVIATAEVAGDGPIFDYLASLAQETNVVICAGFIEACAQHRFLAHYIVFPDGAFRVQRKTCVTAGEAPLQSPLVGERARVRASDESISWQVFEVVGVKCALVICADFGMEALGEHLRELGVELQLLATGAGGGRETYTTTQELRTEAGRRKYMALLERVLAPMEAVESCLKFRHAMAAVNLCGFDGQSHYHAGHGFIVSALGEVAALFHGLPNLDRQRALYAFARIDAAQTVDSEPSSETFFP